MVLDQSDVSMFDYQHAVLIIAAILGFWDYKFTLFVLCPIYLIGFYFYLLGIKNLGGYENFNIQTRIFREVGVVGAIVIANYVQ
jgi:hypothetical protein